VISLSEILCSLDYSSSSTNRKHPLRISVPLSLTLKLNPTAVCDADTFDAILLGLEDYTVDQRGDVGSWVRSASLIALSKISTHHPLSLGKEKRGRAVRGCLGLTVDRIDSLREVAWGASRTVVESVSASESGEDGGTIRVIRKVFAACVSSLSLFGRSLFRG